MPPQADVYRRFSIAGRGTFGPVFLKQNFNLLTSIKWTRQVKTRQVYSVKWMIISNKIKLGSKKWRINGKNTCF